MYPSGLPGPGGQRDSWPPTQLRLRPRTEGNDADIEDMDLSKMDDDPLTYFLTPAPFADEAGGDGMDFEMDFDAGIEDAKHPPPIIRSVSPSSLEGLSLPPPRPPTPPKSPGTPDSLPDMPLTPDDVDDYMQFAAKTRSFTFPIRLSDLTGKKPSKNRPPKDRDHTDAFLAPAPAPYLPGSSRGRSAARPGPTHPTATTLHGVGGPRGRARTTITSRRSPHSWREPSPDVWSIEEEDGESEIQDSTIEQGEMARTAKAQAIDIPAAKPKKRVRFVLPVMD
ncbi:hypothetical protein B0H66DRAFT_121791 [Apodospora peruviana]|uniref:Uncharacterized protein n=1 Tax=Apodospora peruviana TaxID=516989 RepID=A0AAE0MAW1_9PEZI|nr:hypothetical protein B0H66DRAFT_121791 [Apodospora peruviana]